MLGSLAAAAGIVQVRSAGTISNVDTIILFFLLGAFYFAGTVLIDHRELKDDGPQTSAPSQPIMASKYLPLFMVGFGAILAAAGQFLLDRSAHKLVIACLMVLVVCIELTAVFLFVRAKRPGGE